MAESRMKLSLLGLKLFDFHDDQTPTRRIRSSLEAPLNRVCLLKDKKKLKDGMADERSIPQYQVDFSNCISHKLNK